MSLQHGKTIIISLALVAIGVVILAPANAAAGATNIPVLWSAGGLSAGFDSAGQAARIATDASGNVAVVSGPSFAQDLAVTSYTASGSFRWRGTVTPSVGTFRGDWVAAAPNGDFVAIGTNVTSRGSPIGLTMVRFGFDGLLLWRVDIVRMAPYVARLLVDSGSNSYLALSSVGDGQDIQVLKYSPSGVLLWSQIFPPASLPTTWQRRWRSARTRPMSWYRETSWGAPLGSRLPTTPAPAPAVGW